MNENNDPLTDPSGRENSPRCEPVVSRSKTDIKFWRARIFKPVYTRADGSRVKSANYAAQICFRGRRIKWSLDTSNREAAAMRAKEIYLFLQANGWEATIARYRPPAIPQAGPSLLTVGEFLEAIEATRQLSAATFADYRQAFQKIVAQVAGISGSDKKRYGSEHERWLETIHAVKLAQVTPEKIERWKSAFLARAKPDPLSQRSARVSANSYLHRAKCLFGKQILKHLRVALPDPLPFSGVEFEKRPRLKYHSNFDVRVLVAQARAELGSDPDRVELFKIFVLAAMCGLRRREIDLLPWTAFRWDQGVLRIEATEYFEPKSDESSAELPLDPEVCALFRGYYARAKSEFVIESDLALNVRASYLHYRCGPLFRRLSVWLRVHGVRTLRPLHTLRKEFGSLINETHGIHAASRALRHAEIGITSAIYVDARVRTTSGLGSLLAEQHSSNVLPLQAAGQ